MRAAGGLVVGWPGGWTPYTKHHAGSTSGRFASALAGTATSPHRAFRLQSQPATGRIYPLTCRRNREAFALNVPSARPVLRRNALRLTMSAGVLSLLVEFAIAADTDVRFNRDVRPILAEKCGACHGADAQARQADLQLD